MSDDKLKEITDAENGKIDETKVSIEQTLLYKFN